MTRKEAPPATLRRQRRIAVSIALAFAFSGAGAQQAPAGGVAATGATATTNASNAANTSPAPGAVVAGEGSKDPETVRRLRDLSAELRCLVCQNQTLADSNADLAVDLRRQVEAMIARGDSDATIKHYLVDRYGDFVLYRPPVQGNTALLWFGPFALLSLGAIAWIVIQRRSRRANRTPDTASADDERARRLLDD